MIIKCGKVIIDTEEDHVAHKIAIEKHAHFMCSRNDPEYIFTQDLEGEHRFYYLFYNKEGNMLQKIDYWNYKEVNKTVYEVEDPKACYFTKNSNKVKKIVKEGNYSDKHIPVWKRDKDIIGRYKK